MSQGDLGISNVPNQCVPPTVATGMEIWPWLWQDEPSWKAPPLPKYHVIQCNDCLKLHRMSHTFSLPPLNRGSWDMCWYEDGVKHTWHFEVYGNLTTTLCEDCYRARANTPQSKECNHGESRQEIHHEESKQEEDEEVYTFRKIRPKK